MKAIRIHKHGAIEKLSVDQLDEPILQPDEVLIEVKAAALNHLDLWVRQGIPGVPLPLIMGSDAAGVILDLGALVQRDFDFTTGQEVLTLPFRSCGHCRFCMKGQENLCSQFHIPGESIQGVQAQRIAVPAKYLFPKPKKLNWAESAALPLAALTAYHMLITKAGLLYGDRVLIYGASSGVGSAAIQIAKAIGAEVFTTAGSAEKATLAKNLGADHVINYKEESIPERIKEATNGSGVNIVFEHTGQKTWLDSLRSLCKGGKLVTCGATTGPIVKIDIRALFIKQQQLIGSTMGTRNDFAAVLQMVERGQLKAVVSKIFHYSEVQEAHRFLESGRQFGKVVLDFI